MAHDTQGRIGIGSCVPIYNSKFALITFILSLYFFSIVSFYPSPHTKYTCAVTHTVRVRTCCDGHDSQHSCLSSIYSRHTGHIEHPVPQTLTCIFIESFSRWDAWLSVPLPRSSPSLLGFFTLCILLRNHTYVPFPVEMFSVFPVRGHTLKNLSSHIPYTFNCIFVFVSCFPVIFSSFGQSTLCQ